MTDEQMEAVTYAVNCRMWKWHGHPDFEDMRQEAMIAAWLAVERYYQPEQGYQLTTFAGRAAEWAAVNFLRSPAALKRGYRKERQFPPPVILSLEDLREREEGFLSQELRREPEKRADCPRSEDFTPELIDRLDREALIERLRSLCSPGQWETVHACYLQGKGASAYAREEAVSVSAVQQRLNRALNQFRDYLGLPRSCGRRGSWAGGTRPKGPPRTHCAAGHELTPETVYLRTGGQWECRLCMHEYNKGRYWAGKETRCSSP